MRFFVAGLTGNVGGVAGKRLIDEGHTVVAVVRQPEKTETWRSLGAEVLKGDLQDSQVVRSAMKDTDGAFLMMPPIMAPERDFPEARAVIGSYIEALRVDRPAKLAVLSSFGSQQTSGLGNITTTHLLEEALLGIDLPTALVRAGSLIENFIPGMRAAADSGVFYSFLQPVGRKVGMVATKDVGEEVAKLLTASWTGTRRIEIGSYISPDELAAAMSKVLKRNVEAQAIPRDLWAATLEQFGTPKGKTWAVEEIFDGLNSGWIDFGQPGTESVPGATSPVEVFATAMHK